MSGTVLGLEEIGMNKTKVFPGCMTFAYQVLGRKLEF